MPGQKVASQYTLRYKVMFGRFGRIWYALCADRRRREIWEKDAGGLACW